MEQQNLSTGEPISRLSKVVSYKQNFNDDEKKYMSKVWDDIVEKCNALNPSLVVDAGCGRNQYKNLIQNLEGIDIGKWKQADRYVSILDAGYKENSVDAVISIGSIQFMSKEYIKKNVAEVVKWTRHNGLIFMKVNYWDDAMITMLKMTNNSVKVVPWDEQFLYELTEYHNLTFETEPHLVEWNFKKTDNYDSVTERFSTDPERYKKWLWATSNLKKMHWVWKVKKNA